MPYDFEYDADDEAFRREVRQFLVDCLPADMADRNRTAVHTSREDWLDWQAILDRRGWAVPSWPIEHGGTGWSAKRRLIFDEECLFAGAPPPNSAALHMLAPILHAFASDEQRARFLPDMREGKAIWSQGFSEPNAGSDLASLRTRAVRDGEGWLVNGQKIWTSQANIADWIFLLVKTDVEVKAQAGISLMVVRADAPGVTVRPIMGIDGHVSLCETFYDNVRVPPENVIGEIGKGWSYAKYLLGHERISAADVPRNKLYLKRLHDLARLSGPDDQALAGRHDFAPRLAELQIGVTALELSALRALGEGEQGDKGVPIASVLKLCGTELLQKLSYALVETIGPYAAVDYAREIGAPGSPPVADIGPAYAPDIAAEALFRRSSTIYGGSSEIQRQIIAKTLLECDPAPVGNKAGAMSSFLIDSAQRFVGEHYGFAERPGPSMPGAETMKRNWAFFAEMGWLGVGLPEDVGGLGGSAFDTAALLEVFGGALVVEPYVASAILAAQAIVNVATPDQRQALLPPLVSGASMVALLHAEPSQGGRVERIETRAERTGDGYALSGRKAMIVGAALADTLIVAARTSGRIADQAGISLFVVSPTARGISRHDYSTLDGRLASDYILDDVRLPATALLGEAGQAFEALSLAVDQAIMASCAELLGAMSKAFWLTRDYLLVRKQFGSALANFQVLQHRLADMYVEIDQARSIVYHGLAGLEIQDVGARRQAVSAAKVKVTSAAHFVCGQAIQLHGGIGMTEEYAIGHYFKRMVVTDSQFGNARYHLDQVVKAMAANGVRA